MERMTLREAAERVGLSVTTLRRYIRRGRLRAEKLAGRFGPEYFVSDEGLETAGLDGSDRRAAPPDPVRGPIRSLTKVPSREMLPIGLYQELQMKHEQLLVQYGMVRASGLRMLELQGDLDAKRREVEECRAEIVRLRDRLATETTLLRQKLRAADLEVEGRGLEIAALREKVRGLEMLTRNAVTSETIERQFASVMEQKQVVDRLTEQRETARSPRRPWPPAERPAEPEH
ncbi:MAG: helix-turn-helix domain-containing protein [Acidobacteriia bacterium]|nr:helix-turn-helix domain-containing protein [Terriglobia bacterium]